MSGVYLMIYADAFKLAAEARARGDKDAEQRAIEACKSAQEGLAQIERSERRYRLACMILAGALLGVITQIVMR